MLRRSRFAFLPLVAALLLAGPASAAELLNSLKMETPELQSAGALAFGPEGILFVGDAQAAAVFAIDTGDRTPATGQGRPQVEAIDEKLASLLGTESKQLLINDMAVNPLSGNTYLSVSRGRGPDAKAVLVRVDRSGKLGELALKGARYAKVALPNAPGDKGRQEAITDLAYVKGKVYVAGLSNEEFASKLRVIPFPFSQADNGTSVEIFHGAHGRLETRSPVRTFVPYDINGQDFLVAAYQCTPLVKFPVTELKPGQKIRGTTVAELGNRNRPLDMVAYQKGGKNYLLIANSSRGLMKVPTEGIATQAGINEKINDKAGLKYETIEAVKGVEQLDRFDDTHALALLRTQGGALNLQPIALP